jgi:hypothetical protein
VAARCAKEAPARRTDHLRDAPPEVSWVELDGKEDRKMQLTAARVNAPGGSGSVLIIGDSRSPDSQRQFASQTPGAVASPASRLQARRRLVSSRRPRR